MYYEGREWVADVEDEAINRTVDFWPMRHQASVFFRYWESFLLQGIGKHILGCLYLRRRSVSCVVML